MISYKFYLDKADLVCEYRVSDVTFYKFAEDAIALFSVISKGNYNNIKANEDSILLNSTRATIEINDYDILYKYGSDSGYTLAKQVKKSIVKEQLKKVSGKMVKPSLNGIVEVSAGLGVIFLLFSLTNIKVLGAVFPEYSVETIELEDDLELDSSEPLKIDYMKHDPELKSVTLVKNDINYSNDEIIDELNKELNDIIGESEYITLEQEQTDYSQTDNHFITLECDDNSSSPDVDYVLGNYGEIIHEASLKYGISENLLTAIIVQESHGLGDNLMQISLKAHEDEIKTAYNFENGKWDVFVITNKPYNYDDNYIVYTSNDLQNPYDNIMCGAAIFSSYYHKYCGSNLIAGLVCYNQGPGTLSNVVQESSSYLGVTKDDILSDPYNIDFVKDVHELSVGDPYYVEHVLQYAKDCENGIYMYEVENNELKENLIAIERVPRKVR